MKIVQIVQFVVFVIFMYVGSDIHAQTTYTWTGSTSNDYQVSSNWSPNRNSPSTSDILKFNTGGSITVTNIPTETIGRLIIETSGTNVTFQSAASGNILTISSLASGDDFTIASGCTLNITTNNAFTLNIPVGVTGSISGTITMSGGAAATAHRLLASDAGSVVFNSGSLLTQGTNFSGNIFGTAAGNNVIVFSSGSVFEFYSGSNPFGLAAPNSKVQFQSGSLYKHKSSNAPAFSGRVYADFELDVSGSISPTGSSAVSIDNLTVTSGTLNFNVTSNPGHSIKGNINVQAAGTLNFNPSSSGTVYINGVSAQSIGGFTTNSNSTIVINNSNGITLNKPVSIGGTLDMTSGNINSTTNLLTIGLSTSTIGTLTYTSGMITGSLKRWWNTTTGTAILFPLGTGISYRPLSITFTGGLSSGGTMLVNHQTEALTNNTSDLNDGGYTLNRISSEGLWEVTSGDGLSSGAVYSLDIGTTGLSGINTISAIRIIKRTNSEALWTVDGTHSAGSGNTAKRTGLTGFSQFGIAGNSADNPLNGPLPVRLNSFTCSVSLNNAHLKWITSTENNSKEFEIYRKIKGDNTEWLKVGYVKAKGYSSYNTEYEYQDKNLMTGIYKYKLKQIDINGNSESFILDDEVIISSPEKYFLEQNYPNPFNPVTYISYGIPENAYVTVNIFDISGRLVKVLVNEFKQAGYYAMKFNSDGLSSGVYFYKIKADNFQSIKKMILRK